MDISGNVTINIEACTFNYYDAPWPDPPPVYFRAGDRAGDRGKGGGGGSRATTATTAKAAHVWVKPPPPVYNPRLGQMHEDDVQPQDDVPQPQDDAPQPQDDVPQHGNGGEAASGQ